jgi:hypothetical protein
MVGFCLQTSTELVPFAHLNFQQANTFLYMPLFASANFYKTIIPTAKLVL